MNVAENIRQVRQVIAEAAARSGRDPSDVRLMAVTKTVSDGLIVEALQAGVEIIGENYVQEARRKRDTIGIHSEFHMIGRLQRNKVKQAVQLFDTIQSVDRLDLAAEIDRHARAAGLTMKILIEINLAREASKSGIPLPGTERFVREVAAFPNLSLQGLMTMPPWFDDPEGARPFFRTLRELRDSLAGLGIPRVSMRELSMGMTGDYAVAVEEGATIVRIGRGIFGERPPRVRG